MVENNLLLLSTGKLIYWQKKTLRVHTLT